MPKQANVQYILFFFFAVISNRMIDIFRYRCEFVISTQLDRDKICAHKQLTINITEIKLMANREDNSLIFNKICISLAVCAIN